MDSKSTPQSEEAAANADLALCLATGLAASGQLEEAQTLLCQDGQLPSTPQALDLLARLAVQSGDFVRARELWQAALRVDPSFESAKKAFASLGTPWFALAVTKRIVSLAFTTAVGCLAFVGLLALFHFGSEPTSQTLTPSVYRLESASHRTVAIAATKPIEQTATMVENELAEALAQLKESQEIRAKQLNQQIQTLQESQNQILDVQDKLGQQVTALAAFNQMFSSNQNASIELVEQTRKEVRALAEAYADERQLLVAKVASNATIVPLNLPIGGVSIHPIDDGWEIRFDEALFDRGDRFAIGSKSLIESVAKALVRTQLKFSVQVVGFAADEPRKWPWSKPKSDAELGQIRADRVKQVITSLSLFPEGALSATIGPSADAPHQGDSPRNRTVILRIHQHIRYSP